MKAQPRPGCGFCDRYALDAELENDIVDDLRAEPDEWAMVTEYDDHDRPERRHACPECRAERDKRRAWLRAVEAGLAKPRRLTDAEKIEALRLVVARCSVWLSTFAPTGNINIVKLKLDCDNALYLTEAKP